MQVCCVAVWPGLRLMGKLGKAIPTLWILLLGTAFTIRLCYWTTHWLAFVAGWAATPAGSLPWDLMLYPIGVVCTDRMFPREQKAAQKTDWAGDDQEDEPAVLKVD